MTLRWRTPRWRTQRWWPLTLTTAIAALAIITGTTVRAGQAGAGQAGAAAPASAAPASALPATALPATVAPDVSDPVSRLARQIEAGEVTLPEDERFGRLPALLRQLKIPADSQGLVFSKTSFQYRQISPSTPRAIYFNDDVYVGSVVDGEVIELVTVAPRRGLRFYTVDTRGPSSHLVPRGAECASCHGQGLMVQSVLPGPDGTPLAFVGPGSFPLVDHRTPVASRWGGWYVTGTHGTIEHLGNAFTSDPLISLELTGTNRQNRTTLDDRIDVSRFLEPSSDIVSLMTLEHQTRMTNLLIALSRQASNAPAAQVSALVDETATYMLFADEAPFDQRIRGTSTFTDSFAARGPRDPQGRTLRDFDLQTRLFRYPVSYMIYSDVFESIPAPLRERLYRKLFDALSGTGTPHLARIGESERRAALEIIRATKPGLPSYWAEMP